MARALGLEQGCVVCFGILVVNRTAASSSHSIILISDAESAVMSAGQSASLFML